MVLLGSPSSQGNHREHHPKGKDRGTTTCRVLWAWEKRTKISGGKSGPFLQWGGVGWGGVGLGRALEKASELRAPSVHLGQ